MAKPISITPPLEGKEARDFLKRMNEPSSKKDRKYKKKLEDKSHRFVPF